MRDHFWIGVFIGLVPGMFLGLALACANPKLVLLPNEWSAVIHEREGR